jgi:hypothetical protein
MASVSRRQSTRNEPKHMLNARGRANPRERGIRAYDAKAGRREPQHASRIRRALAPDHET